MPPKKGAIYTCEVCNETFSQIGSANRHFKNKHTDEKAKSYECCGKNFIYKTSLVRHRKKEHPLPIQISKNIIRVMPETYECDTCHRIYQRKDFLMRHIKEKHECAESYECDHCKKKFDRKWTLRKHLQRCAVRSTTHVSTTIPNTVMMSPGPLLDAVSGRGLHDIDRIEEMEAEDTSSHNVISGGVHRRSYEELEAENRRLKGMIEAKERTLLKFLNKDQIQALESTYVMWSNETLLKSLKLRIILSKDGWDALRETGYPAPSYSTIMRRIEALKLNFGIFEPILTLLQQKAVNDMDEKGKYCVIAFDEMEIAKVESFDKNRDELYGYCTLGNQNAIAKKLLLVLLRSWNADWKQIISAHLTDVSTDGKYMKEFILDLINKVESIGLIVNTLSSDAGSNNTNLWKELGCGVSRTQRNNKFVHNGHEIFILPDVCHVLKNLKLATMNNLIELPSGEIVRGEYVTMLWNWEVKMMKKIRKLYHLREKDLNPNSYDKMKVGPAVRFFSSQTAAALEDAVRDSVLPQDAMATASFIRIIEKWFEITSAKHDFVLTQENAPEELHFLRCVVEIFQHSKIGRSWKPSNTNVILSTLSIIDLCTFFFANGFDSVRTHKGTTDALENVNSQVRKRAASHPTAKQCLDALKMITVGQFIREVRNTNYHHDTDTFLLNFIRDRATHRQSSNLDFDFLRSEILRTLDFQDATFHFSNYDLSSLYYAAGSCTRAMLKKKICNNCREFLETRGSNPVIELVETYTQSLDRGKLLYCNELVFQLIINCHYFLTKYEKMLKENCAARKSVLLDKIRNEVVIELPECCDLKEKIVKHFSTFYMFSATAFTQNVSKNRLIHGTASSKSHK